MVKKKTKDYSNLRPEEQFNIVIGILLGVLEELKKLNEGKK